MTTITSLQSSLEARAKKRAEDEASAFIHEFTRPFKAGTSIIVNGGEIRLWDLKELLRIELTRQLYVKYLKEETDNLLSAFDKIESLRNQVEQLG